MGAPRACLVRPLRFCVAAVNYKYISRVWVESLCIFRYNRHVTTKRLLQALWVIGGWIKVFLDGLFVGLTPKILPANGPDVGFLPADSFLPKLFSTNIAQELRNGIGVQST